MRQPAAPPAFATATPTTKIALTPTPKPLGNNQSAHLQKIRAQEAALVAGLRGQLLRVPMPYSPNLHRALTAWVYLPPNYDKSDARYPVAYILHGAPGTVRDCFVNGGVHRVAEKLILSGQITPTILVGWDADGPKGAHDATYYLNRRDGYNMENFEVDELVPWVDRTFRTRANAQSRALIGFSAGGYGAANLGLKHPDVWQIIASHAGFFDPSDDPKSMTQILGPPSALWTQNSPLALARTLPMGAPLHFYMDISKSDPLLGEFKKMKAELKARRIDFAAHIDSGAHNWKSLHQHYFDSLRFADKNWKEPTS